MIQLTYLRDLPLYNRAKMLKFLLLLFPALTAATCSNMIGCSCDKMRMDRFPVKWGFSGYGNGHGQFPALPQLADMKRDFGAKGDGYSDDTEAFRRAGSRWFGRAGFIKVPAGKYIIKGQMDWRTDAMFRGEGMGKTVLHFPKPLRDMLGSRSYGYGPFFINVYNSYPLRDTWTISEVQLPLKRGSRRLCLKDAHKARVGMRIYVVGKDQQGGYGVQRELHAHAPINMGSPTPYGDTLKFYTKILAIHGSCITINKPAPVTYPSGWHAFVHTSGDTFQGASDMTFSFSPSPYLGHTRETGKNVFLIKGLSNTYMRNLEFQNVDFGMYIVACHGSTFSNIRFLSSNKPDRPDRDMTWEFGSTGHYGIQVYNRAFNRVQNVEYRTKLVHDISVTDLAVGTVFSGIRGVDLVLDMHRGAPYATLWEDIYLGRGTRPLRCFGDHKYGPPAGAFTTYYNVRGPTWVHKAQDQMGANFNWIGVVSRSWLPFKPVGWRYDRNNTVVWPTTLDCWK